MFSGRYVFVCLILLSVSFFLLSAFFNYFHGLDHQLHQHEHNRKQENQIGTDNSLILASERSRRIDVLDGLNHYTGGWNPKNIHYWASVGFTAAPLVLSASVWFIIFGPALLLFCCCFRRRAKGPFISSPRTYAFFVSFLILFAIAALVGCASLYHGQKYFHQTTEDMLENVLKKANSTGEHLKNVSDYLGAAQKIKVANFLLGPDVQINVTEMIIKINSSATTLAKQMGAYLYDIQCILHKWKLRLVVIAAMVLVFASFGFLLSILGMHFVLSIFVVLGWILVACTIILCGLFLVLHNVVTDTCEAMDQWDQSPNAHTAVDDILPCMNKTTATETLLRTKEVSFKVVEMVNEIIGNIANAKAPLFYNQSGSLMPILCNPLYANLTDRECATGEIGLTNATQVWQSYVCLVSSNGVCTTIGRLTPDYYIQMTAAANVSFGLYHYGPFLVELEDCTFLRETFQDISRDHCPRLTQYIKWIYIGLVIVSVALMLSLMVWVLHAISEN